MNKYIEETNSGTIIINDIELEFVDEIVKNECEGCYLNNNKYVCNLGAVCKTGKILIIKKEL